MSTLNIIKIFIKKFQAPRERIFLDNTLQDIKMNIHDGWFNMHEECRVNGRHLDSWNKTKMRVSKKNLLLKLQHAMTKETKNGRKML